MKRPAGRPRTVRAGTVTEQRRQELVQAAFNQIAQHGFEGLRTRDVASEVGVNIATLHYYFPTKEALIRGVLDSVMERFRVTLEPHGSPADQLRNHLRAVRKLMTDEPHVASVMGELALRSTRDKSIASIMDKTYDVWQTTMRGLLRRAVREGGASPELDSDAVAAIIMTTLTAMPLPHFRGNNRSDQAFKQLERWLGTGNRRVSSN
jgi:AcrR family transcriptional regulator